MRVRVLGACAGGGLPQWNCGCENCVGARAGDPALPRRTQPSIAISADGERWSILNASPDIRLQLLGFPALHPRPGTRDLPLDSLLLTNADLDHVMGLLVLREALSYRILSTAWLRDTVLEHNAAFRLLEPVWTAVPLDAPIPLDREGRLVARLFPVPGKVPGYLKDCASNHKETTVGVRVHEPETGRRLVYVPGTRELDAGILAEAEAATCTFLDGTFFSADELQRIRPGAPDAFAMCHVPITGDGGSLESFAALPGRRLYIHMNNTNPILREGSPEARRIEGAGIEIARAGMEFTL